MTAIKHHLTDGLLADYSAGVLPEAFGLVVATHVSLCDECRARLGALDAIGGAILDGGDTAAVGDGALSATLALISRGPKDPIPAPARKAAVFPAPLRDYVGGDLDAVRWRPVGGGVRQAVLSTGTDATARLLRIPAGAQVPDHGHRGVELTLVLKGAFHDEDGHFRRGDIEVADESLDHTPVADTGEDCICLAATDAPLRFNSLMPRLAQRFIGI